MQATAQKNLENVVARDRVHPEGHMLINPMYVNRAALANHGNEWASGCLHLGEAGASRCDGCRAWAVRRRV